MVNLLAAGLVIIGSFIGSLGTLIIKKGVDRYPLRNLWYKPIFGIGFIFYAISTLLYVLALRQEQLTFIYPLVSTAYLWTIFFSVKFLGEKMNLWKWVGIVGIILGVVLVGLGS